MAKKRMFAQTIIDSDAFLDMPISTQALYFHLSMRADDDGFVNNPKRIARYIGASEDDLKLLFAKRFVLGFPSGVIAIKHWRMNNDIRKDRYHPTVYQNELASLAIKPNGAYTDDPNYIPSLPPATNPQPNDNQSATNPHPDGCQSGNQMDTETRLGKVRLGKDSTGIDKKPCKKTKTFTEDSKPYICAVFLGKRIKKRLPSTEDPTEETLQRWAYDFDKCNRLDNHEWSEIKLVLEFSQRDPFWQANILSGAKFRKQYMALLAKMTAEANPQSRPIQRESTLDRAQRLEMEGAFDE